MEWPLFDLHFAFRCPELLPPVLIDEPLPDGYFIFYVHCSATATRLLLVKTGWPSHVASGRRIRLKQENLD